MGGLSVFICRKLGIDKVSNVCYIRRVGNVSRPIEINSNQQRRRTRMNAQQQARYDELKETARTAFEVRDWETHDKARAEMEILWPRPVNEKWTGKQGHAAGIYHGIRR